MSCMVCDDARRQEADALLSSGRTLRAVERRLGISYAALKRHVALGHVGGSASSSPVGRGPSGGQDPVADLRFQLRTLQSVDLSKLTPAQLNSHIEQRRRVAEAYARYAPPPPGPRTVRIAEVEGLADLIETLFEVLEPHASVRAELLAALEKRGIAGLIG